MACSGNPDNCAGQPEATCELCGCEWDWEFGTCMGGMPSDCDTHGNQGDCEDCGCTWAVPTNIKINISDTFKDVDEIYINVGDTWKTVTAVYINIGDSWKTVFFN